MNLTKIEPEDLDFLSQMVMTLEGEDPLSNHSHFTWVVYGSYATHSHKNGSDVDVLCIVETDTAFAQRLQFYFREVPITVYYLSVSELIADGSDMKYGGYFSYKLFNPRFTIKDDNKIQSSVDRIPFDFLSNFLSIPLSDDSETALKQLLGGYLKTCPWYLAYLYKLYVLPDFGLIWELMKKYVSSQLNTQPITPSPIPKVNSSICMARFWTFGSICHGAYTFGDLYINKSANYLKSVPTQQLASLVTFLELEKEEWMKQFVKSLIMK